MNFLSDKGAFSAIFITSFLTFLPAFVQANPVAPVLPIAKPGIYLEENSGAAERIDAADRLRTLSWEIPAAACHLARNVAPDDSRALLKEARAEFQAITDALLNGSERYGIIGRETKARTLTTITEAISAWVPTDGAVRVLLDEPQNADALGAIDAGAQPVNDATSQLLGQLTAAYTNPFELLLGDAILIDLSGRLSMLTQKISKEVCTVWTGDRSERVIADLNSSIAQFDLTAQALRNGAPSLGIKPAPTPAIRASLEEVLTDWDAVLEQINGVLANAEVSDQTKTFVFHALNDKMYKLDNIVHQYTAYSKHKTE